ncbi:MAG: hypothetical protein M0P52_14205, partial [Rhodoferax sp.]|nr:hypothetical protein [Rhodoferax sp.]
MKAARLISAKHPLLRFVTCARRFTPVALHQLIKSAHIGARPAFQKELLCLHHGQLFSHSNADKLMDADTILLAHALHA